MLKFKFSLLICTVVFIYLSMGLILNGIYDGFPFPFMNYVRVSETESNFNVDIDKHVNWLRVFVNAILFIASALAAVMMLEAVQPFIKFDSTKTNGNDAKIGDS